MVQSKIKVKLKTNVFSQNESNGLKLTSTKNGRSKMLVVAV